MSVLCVLGSPLGIFVLLVFYKAEVVNYLLAVKVVKIRIRWDDREGILVFFHLVDGVSQSEQFFLLESVEIENLLFIVLVKDHDVQCTVDVSHDALYADQAVVAVAIA